MAGHSFVIVATLLVALLVFLDRCSSVTSQCTNNSFSLTCKNITDFPKNISKSVKTIVIYNSVLNSASFENIAGLTKLDKLEIYGSTLKDFAFEKLNFPISMTDLKIHGSNIKNIGVFKLNTKLSVLDISQHTNLKIDPGAFDNLYSLKYLILNYNQLDNCPVFNRLKCLQELHLEGNNIKQLRREHLSNLHALQKLDFTGNPIKSIQFNAFKNLSSLKTLVLDGSEIETLPTNGLHNLENLSLKNVHTLLKIPNGLNSLHHVELAKDKSFLCCKLKFQRRQGLTKPVTHAAASATAEGCTHPTALPNRSTRSHETIPSGFGKRKRRVRPITLEPSITPNMSLTFNTIPAPIPLKCIPGPTPFQPCEDIMGADWLTAISFIVAPFALCGNFLVVLVFLCMARNYNVSRFLVTNLAIADMSMGIYLLCLVIESVITSGEYYLHVERFQLGTSCKVLGFLAMFSSELSVFALTLITVERYLTIVYAMYPKRRLTMRTAVVCMAIGWTVAFTTAILPIVGVGSYSKVAICLPFDTQNGGDLYLFFVFGLNGVSFVFICALYAQIYRSVFKTNNSTPTRGHDSRVARRMAILVFTDFACFAPIAVAGLSALLGHSLIDVRQSKYLLVFFFPLNGVLNPFLYAIITKTFRRDLATLLKSCFACGGTLTNYLSNFPARSVQSTNDALSPSARPSLDFNAMGFHSMGNIRGSRENPISASFSKSEPNLVKFSQEGELDS